MGQPDRTNPESGWPRQLRPPQPPDLDTTLLFFERVAAVGNAYFNALHSLRRLSLERARTVDSMISLVATGRIAFPEPGGRQEFLALSRQMLEQLRKDDEIVDDLCRFILEETEKIKTPGNH